MVAAPELRTFTNLDRVLWPEDDYTKGDLIHYYRSVSKWILRYLVDRPITLERYPAGIDGGSFFEKNAPRGAPSWIKTIVLPSGGKRPETRYVLCNDEPTLLYLANLAAITLHVWTSRVGSLDEPDFVFFDFDPWEGCTLSTLAHVVLEVRRMLEEIKLTTLVKTSGGTGLHVLVPLGPGHTYDDAKRFAQLVAQGVASVLPERVTLERSLAKRPRGTVYVDWAQVGKGKTLVPPYTVRAEPNAPVSMPIPWSDVERMAKKRAKDTRAEMARFTMANVPTLLEEHGDLWAKDLRMKQRLAPAFELAKKRWEK